MAAALSRHGERLIRRICTTREMEEFHADRDATLTLASIFGIKEAVMKALGTGMRGVGWKEIDSSGASEGLVEDLLRRRALAVARSLEVTRYCFSVSVSNEIVVAAALLSGDDSAARPSGQGVC